jgi:ABC-type transporter Mla subunit MlaD
MSDTSNLYQQLKDALNTFKTFLDSEKDTLHTAVSTLKPIVPQVGDLLGKLIDLMGQLKTAVNNIDVNSIPGLDKVSQFTSSATTLLQTAEGLLPSARAAIDDVLSVASVVTGLPSFTTLKADILGLLDAVVADLTAINA